MKTVLMLHHGGNSIRGSEVCYMESVKALSRAGYRTIITRNHPAMDISLADYATAFEQFNYPELMIDGKNTQLPIFKYVTALNHLKRLIRRWQPDVVYANGGLPCQLGVPAGHLLNVPVLCHFHHPAIKRAYYLWLVKYADKVIFPSKYTQEHSRLKAGVEGDVVYNGVDTNLFKPLARTNNDLRASLGLTGADLVVGQVGALVPHKRPQLLLNAFAQIAGQIPQLRLCLVGKGPLETVLRNRVAELGLDQRVVITGFVEHTLPYYQHVIDINVLASIEEGLGISIIEGSSVGLPAVIANGTGLRETVTANGTGLLFEPDDEAGLISAILKLSHDADLRHHLGTAGRQKICSEFAIEGYRAGVTRAIEETSQLRRAQHSQ